MKNQFFELNEILAETISSLLMSMKTKEERIEGLNRLNKIPSDEILKIVNNKALQREDFETCEALKIYAEANNIKL